LGAGCRSVKGGGFGGLLVEGRRRRLLAWFALAATSAAAHAHHSTAPFSTEFIELEGTIVRVDWRNPHVELALEAASETGQPTVWRLISNSLYDLARAGISRDVLVIGERVKIAGHASTIEPRVALATNMLRADGTEVVMRRDAQAYWQNEHIGGRDHWLVDESRTVDAERENRGLFRVWSAAEIRASRVYYPFTEAAIAARAKWNLLDNFMLRCEPPGMPQIMTAPHPYELIDHGDAIVLRSAWFNQDRTIYLLPERTVVSPPEPSRLGYSVGRWEGSTLVVETTAIDWPYADGIGTPQSAAVRITEHFTPSADQRRLDYRAAIVDPATFTEPATYETSWLALGESIEAYDCKI
jgi:Family of unknown function (DUF6152)